MLHCLTFAIRPLLPPLPPSARTQLGEAAKALREARTAQGQAAKQLMAALSVLWTPRQKAAVSLLSRPYFPDFVVRVGWGVELVHAQASRPGRGAWAFAGGGAAWPVADAHPPTSCPARRRLFASLWART